MAMGGTIPPAITAAMTSKFPSASCAVPNTYAALLNGPPMSMDIIPPSTIPSTILLAPPILPRNLVSPSLIMPIYGLINVVTTAARKMPITGYKSTGLIPSSDLGSLEKSFLNPTTI